MVVFLHNKTDDHARENDNFKIIGKLVGRHGRLEHQIHSFFLGLMQTIPG